MGNRNMRRGGNNFRILQSPILHVGPEVERLFYEFLESLKSLGYKVFYIDVQKTERYCDTWRDVRYAQTSEVHELWLKTRLED
jgi:hypothetical protein